MSVAMTTESRSAFVQQFLSGFEARIDGAPAWLVTLQKDAYGRVQELDVPGRRDEEWRFFSLRALTDQQFRTAPARLPDEAALDGLRLEEAAESTIVFVNGQYVPELSVVDALPEGVTVSTWKELAASNQLDAVKEYAGKNAYYADDLFYALNTASFVDGVVIVVPKNVSVKAPIHIVNLSTAAAAPYAVHPRNLIVAEESSEVTVVEEYVSLDDAVYFTNAVNEFYLANNAQVEHFKVQRESTSAFHIARNLVHNETDSRYHSAAVMLGAKISRNDSYARIDGTNVDCTLDGLAYVSGTQIADTHSAMDHQKPHSRSHQLHKVIVDERAHTVFNGKIFVQLDAQKTASYQLNQSLILSERGKVDTKPQLEILADDVVCTHGATVGQLEDDQLFYLESRGLDPITAKSLLTYAFAAEVVETINVESLKLRLEADIFERLTKQASVQVDEQA